MNILLLIHPNFAIENWYAKNTAPKLKSYYDDVIEYISKFNGITIVHLMEPYSKPYYNARLQSRSPTEDDPDNAINWKYYNEFMDALKSMESDKVKLTWDASDLGNTFGNIMDELLLTSPPKKIYLAGGYYGDCLRKTYNELIKQYGTYFDDVGTKIYKVSSLIFVPGNSPHRLSDADVDKYQKSYVDAQGGRNYSSWHWSGMDKGENLPESVRSPIDIAQMIPEELVRGLIFETANKLLTQINSLRPQMAAAAQAAYDAWEQDEEGIDEELGGGGICQDIADGIADVLASSGVDVMTVDSEGMGEQHVWVIAYDDDLAFEVDIPYHAYETGGGYSWGKIPGVIFDANSIVVSPLDRELVPRDNF
jgi:hypothetical protein